MNIKTITLMDFDWGDFIGAMKVNIRASLPLLVSNYNFDDCIFKLHLWSFI